MTNAERIRNMTDDELAVFLTKFKNTFGEEYEGEKSCLDWLKESEEITMNKNIPKERLCCKYCWYCMCTEDTIGGAYCCADIHDYIRDVENSEICPDFDYDDTFKRT